MINELIPSEPWTPPRVDNRVLDYTSPNDIKAAALPPACSLAKMNLYYDEWWRSRIAIRAWMILRIFDVDLKPWHWQSDIMEANPQVRDPSHPIRGCIPPVWSQNFASMRLTAPEDHSAYRNDLAVPAYCRQHGRSEMINNMPCSDMLKLGCGPSALLADRDGARENLARAVDVLLAAESSTTVASTMPPSSSTVMASSSTAAESSTAVASMSTAASSSTAVASSSPKMKKEAVTSSRYTLDNVSTSPEALITGRQQAVDIMPETATRRFDMRKAAPPSWADPSFAVDSHQAWCLDTHRMTFYRKQ